ncbi:unnamed protein product [Rhizoctonia solani]|uniref:Uncharacterized protein n=2 Tax=Rhizoctonia solani TaxID=456999 RepID=A0A8H3DDG6_9AGAM
MISVSASSNVLKSRSIFAKRIALLSQIIMPKPKVGPSGPRSAYMLKKGRRSKPKSGAARISAEKKYVKGLGYIRADATPVRSRDARSAAASERNSYSSVPVEAIDLQICSELVALSEFETMENIAEPSSGRVGSLYDGARFPSTTTWSWVSFE